jgi:hypothetical protein
MIRRLIALLLCVLLPAAVIPLSIGCGDEVESVKQTEEVHQSQPEPVAPGEPVVE